MVKVRRCTEWSCVVPWQLTSVPCWNLDNRVDVNTYLDSYSVGWPLFRTHCPILVPNQMLTTWRKAPLKSNKSYSSLLTKQTPNFCHSICCASSGSDRPNERPLQIRAELREKEMVFMGGFYFRIHRVGDLTNSPPSALNESGHTPHVMHGKFRRGAAQSPMCFLLSFDDMRGILNSYYLDNTGE